MMFGPVARAGGWRFRNHPTKKEMQEEIDHLRKVRTNLQRENAHMRIRLNTLQRIADPDVEATVTWGSERWAWGDE